MAKNKEISKKNQPAQEAMNKTQQASQNKAEHADAQNHCGGNCTGSNSTNSTNSTNNHASH